MEVLYLEKNIYLFPAVQIQAKTFYLEQNIFSIQSTHNRIEYIVNVLYFSQTNKQHSQNDSVLVM